MSIAWNNNTLRNENINNQELFNNDNFITLCDEIIEELSSSMHSSSVDRQLDCAIVKIQNILKGGTKEQKDYIFNIVYEKFQFFIKKQIANLFLINADKEDLVQEATLCFYNSILNYDKDRGAFIFFAKTFIQRNIWTLITKSQKHKKNNISFVSIDNFSSDESKNNYDDYLYYRMIDSETMEDAIVAKEQTRDYLKQMEDILTERERVSLYLYLQGASYEEIAEVCGICEKSVDNSLHRAKSKMKSVYKKDTGK